MIIGHDGGWWWKDERGEWFYTTPAQVAPEGPRLASAAASDGRTREEFSMPSTPAPGKVDEVTVADLRMMMMETIRITHPTPMSTTRKTRKSLMSPEEMMILDEVTQSGKMYVSPVPRGSCHSPERQRPK